MKKLSVLVCAVTIIIGLVYSVPAFAGGRVVVAESGGDYDNPVTAMKDENLATWCGVPSIDNPCLIKIKGGDYPINTALVMQDYVSIEGSGPENTKILSADFFGSDTGIVNAADAELKDLTIEKIDSGPLNCQPGSIGLRIKNTHARIRNVNVILNNQSCDSGNLIALSISNTTDQTKFVILYDVETDVLMPGIAFTTGASINGNVGVTVTDSVIKESGAHSGLTVSPHTGPEGVYDPWISIVNSTISSGWHAINYTTNQVNYLSVAYSTIVGDFYWVPAGVMNCVGLKRNGSPITCP